MAETVYVLGALVTLICSVLLLKRYAQVRLRLLLWSGLCFAVLTFSNAMVFVDFVLIPNSDLYLVRLFSATGAMGLLLYGLIWDGE